MKPYFIIVDKDLQTIFVDYTATFDPDSDIHSHVTDVLVQLNRSRGPQYLMLDARKAAHAEECLYEAYRDIVEAIFAHRNTGKVIVIREETLFTLTSYGTADTVFGGHQIEVAHSHVDAITDIRNDQRAATT